MSVASPILVGFIKGGGVWKVERCGNSSIVTAFYLCHRVTKKSYFFVIARRYCACVHACNADLRSESSIRNICTHNKQL